MGHELKKPLTKNQLDDLTDGLVNAMRYSNPDVVYPNVEAAMPGDGVEPEWFYPIYNGVNDFSELTAIHMYTTQETMFEEIGELMLGIGLTEMKHFGKLGEFITALSGDVKQVFSNVLATPGDSVEEALKNAKAAEERTIKFYDELSDKITKVKETKTTKIALQLIAKLRADEVVHLSLLNEKLKTK